MTTEQLIKEEAEKKYPYKDYEGIMGPVSRKRIREYTDCQRKDFTEGATFGASLNGWVSVKDRLPTDEGNYFVYLSNGQGWQSGWHNNKWYGVDGLDVTHWRRIVKP